MMRLTGAIILSMFAVSCAANPVWGYEGQGQKEEKRQNIVDESTALVEYLEDKPRFKEHQEIHPQHKPNFKNFRSVEFVNEGVIEQMHDDMHQELQAKEAEDPFADAELVSDVHSHTAFEEEMGGVSFITLQVDAVMAPPRKHFSVESITDEFDHKINMKMSPEVSVSTGASTGFSLLETGSQQFPMKGMGMGSMMPPHSAPRPVQYNAASPSVPEGFYSHSTISNFAYQGVAPENHAAFPSFSQTMSRTDMASPPVMPNLPDPPYIEPAW